MQDVSHQNWKSMIAVIAAAVRHAQRNFLKVNLFNTGKPLRFKAPHN